jgi:soluble lytic murein transglycosylase
MLAASLRDPHVATPLVVITAARAAAAWGGWTDVDRLLGTAPWVDTLFGGDGRELLARSALAAGADTASLTQASKAFADARTPNARASRGVLAARALERNNMFDSAAALYASAAAAFPSIHDWLMLRAAGSESDSAARAHAYATITLGAAKPRRLWTEAQARERFRDAIGSAAIYASLGATVTALRLRLSVASDNTTRDSIAAALLAFIGSHRGTADARAAVDVLDKGFTALSPAAELTIGRATAATGAPARAIAAFQRALVQPGLVTAADRVSYAGALSRAGRPHDALAQLDSVAGPLAAQADYQRARVLLTSGTADAVRSALRDVIARFPADTASASAALYLLADLSTDDGHDAQADSLYKTLYTHYPASDRAAAARFNAGMLSFVAGRAAAAGSAFDSLTVMMPRSEDAIAARYWSGRAHLLAGDDTVARDRWRAVVAQQPTSYYAALASARLDEAPWAPAARPDSFPSVPDVDATFDRAELLSRLGMDAEARLEYEALDAAANTPDRLLATAHAFAAHGQPWRSTRLAQKLIDGGRRDARVYRLLYPLLDREELARDAASHGLDAALVAGLIRQESGFNPRAVSIANARGLMQLLPSVGEELSHTLRFPLWNEALLLDPDASLQLGTAHLGSFIQQYGALPRALAAYNAGGSRVSRWSARPGVDDPEVFAERIPFTETRDYVRIVHRNAAIYRALYKF